MEYGVRSLRILVEAVQAFLESFAMGLINAQYIYSHGQGAIGEDRSPGLLKQTRPDQTRPAISGVGVQQCIPKLPLYVHT